ncbi:MAG: hypothetical protein Q7T26_07175 [Dehalococcoidia bacterium]|nr:hypothetical protein [Dehalococcoidia bacterium]
MKYYPPKLSTLLKGLESSYERFIKVQAERDTSDTFIALFETLNWVVSVDDWIKHMSDSGREWYTNFGEQRGLIVPALRYVRARVHHQWAHALYLDPEGAEFPIVFPTGFHEWCWRDSKELPSPDKGHEYARGEMAYDSLLAHKAARHTLQAVLGLVHDQTTSSP